MFFFQLFYIYLVRKQNVFLFSFPFLSLNFHRSNMSVCLLVCQAIVSQSLSNQCLSHYQHIMLFANYGIIRSQSSKNNNQPNMKIKNLELIGLLRLSCCLSLLVLASGAYRATLPVEALPKRQLKWVRSAFLLSISAIGSPNLPKICAAIFLGKLHILIPFVIFVCCTCF